MKNKNTITYIIGILTGLILIPILEELLNVVLTWIEYLKIKPSILVSKGNKELLELQNDGESETSVIGFQYTPEPDEEYDYEEE